MRLKRNFFNRNTIIVAKDLIGKYLVRRVGVKIIAGRIIETEAYCGQRDLACHASKGLTERTKTMFGPPGHAYVYLVYGMYHCLNMVTEKKGYPAAVLIRGIEVVDGLPHGSKAALRGPGKLCRELKIDRKLNGIDVCSGTEIWVEDRQEETPTRNIKRGKRVGVDYAGKWKDKLWRFYLL